MDGLSLPVRSGSRFYFILAAAVVALVPAMQPLPFVAEAAAGQAVNSFITGLAQTRLDLPKLSWLGPVVLVVRQGLRTVQTD
jgi:hypothetical protein